MNNGPTPLEDDSTAPKGNPPADGNGPPAGNASEAAETQADEDPIAQTPAANAGVAQTLAAKAGERWIAQYEELGRGYRFWNTLFLGQLAIYLVAFAGLLTAFLNAEGPFGRLLIPFIGAWLGFAFVAVVDRAINWFKAAEQVIYEVEGEKLLSITGWSKRVEYLADVLGTKFHRTWLSAWPPRKTTQKEKWWDIPWARVENEVDQVRNPRYQVPDLIRMFMRFTNVLWAGLFILAVIAAFPSCSRVELWVFGDPAPAKVALSDLDTTKDDLDSIEGRVADIKKDVGNITTDLNNIEERLGKAEKRADKIEERLEKAEEP